MFQLSCKSQWQLKSLQALPRDNLAEALLSSALGAGSHRLPIIVTPCTQRVGAGCLKV